MRVTVVGLGYVGLVTATCLARLGHDVVGLESDSSKLATLDAGDIPYFEPGLANELATQRASGRLRFTGYEGSALQAPEAILICVGTPSDATGHADLQFVLDVADLIAMTVINDPVILLRSTVPIGTTRRVESRLNEARSSKGRPPVPVFANPEFLRTGRAIEDFLRPTRIVIGQTKLADSAALSILDRLYASLDAPLILTDAESAELVKNASNAFLAMRVSFVNELAALCDASGANVDDVVAGMADDPRIGGQFMRPGIGYGGSCLPKDVRSLIATAGDYGLEMRIASAVDQVNRAQVPHVLGLLEAGLGRSLKGGRIAILGLAFKPDTDDTRESPALLLVDELRNRGVDVVACDPEAAKRVRATRPWLEVVDAPMRAVTSADAVVLATEWPSYVALDMEAVAGAMRGRLIVDGRNALDRQAVADAGLTYVGIGRPTGD
ncbi:MAG: UDP-glucose/GDP-mannose dehydrogenase family protein [Chloroflexota bacterium]|nr:MAG: UDP-glucose/GDP-mannose dehydrogenase family protein [Chloroflexota bacterium]